MCGVKIVRYQRLNKKLNLDTAELQAATRELSEYLSNNVDLLIVTNTFGDTQTTVLLKVVHDLRTNTRITVADGTSTETNADGNGNNNNNSNNNNKMNKVHYPYPLIMMDLPNLGLPGVWHGLFIDAFIAPSKATGLHWLTIQHGNFARCFCE